MFAKGETVIKEVQYGSKSSVSETRRLILTSKRVLFVEEDLDSKGIRLRSIKREHVAGLELHSNMAQRRNGWLIASILIALIAFLFGRMVITQSELLMFFGFNMESVANQMLVGFGIAILLGIAGLLCYQYYRDVTAPYALILHLNQAKHETITFENGHWVPSIKLRSTHQLRSPRFYPSVTLREDLMDFAAMLVE